MASQLILSKAPSPARERSLQPRPVRGVGTVFHLGSFSRPCAAAWIRRWPVMPPVRPGRVPVARRQLGKNRRSAASSTPAAVQCPVAAATPDARRKQPDGRPAAERSVTLTPPLSWPASTTCKALRGDLWHRDSVRLRLSLTSSARGSAPDSPYSGVIALFVAAMEKGRPPSSTAMACNHAISPTWPTAYKRSARPPRPRASRAKCSTSARAAA